MRGGEGARVRGREEGRERERVRDREGEICLLARLRQGNICE
jgi:hypothetical protein